jgi:hypothetical protein
MMDRACRTHEADDKYIYDFSTGSLKDRVHLGDLGVNGTINIASNIFDVSHVAMFLRRSARSHVTGRV